MRNRPSDRSALVKTLYDRVLQRESREIQRLRQVAQWVEQDACQVAALGAHFGDPMDRPCGHCSWCRRGGKPAKLSVRPKAAIDPALWSQAGALRGQHCKELGQPRSLARFLCGVNSPWMLKAKLQTHPLFGALADVPFAEVLRERRIDRRPCSSVLQKGQRVTRFAPQAGQTGQTGTGVAGEQFESAIVTNRAKIEAKDGLIACSRDGSNQMHLPGGPVEGTSLGVREYYLCLSMAQGAAFSCHRTTSFSNSLVQPAAERDIGH